MVTEAIKCPQCGGTLETVAESGIFTCPYCRSRIRVTFTAPDPGRCPDGRTAIFDSETGAELCRIKLARGWQGSGRIIDVAQSANWPLTLRVDAVSPRQDAMISYWSGSSFKEVHGGLASHVEGSFDRGDMMPMKKLRTPAQYADEFLAVNVPAGDEVRLLETRDLPLLPLPDFAVRRQENLLNAQAALRFSTPPGVSVAVDQVYYDGCTRIYDWTQGGRRLRAAVAALLDGTRLTCSVPSLFLPGPKMTFTTWEAQYVVVLRAAPEIFEEQYEKLIMFCSTMQASPALIERIERERQRLTGGLMQRQAEQFDAHQQMMRQQQAAFDAFNQAWLARSEQAHRQNRTVAAAQMSAEDRMSAQYSEAVRGVNTYIRPDGTEVEYSVVNEAAYASVNDSRTTFATQSKDFQSADWVRMEKKF